MIRSDESCFLSDYEESEQKYLNHNKFESNRQKRCKINDLINKESRIKHGAINLLKVCCNEQIERNLKLEIAFAESNIKYLKDQLSEINCDLTLTKMKNTSIYKFNKKKFLYHRFDNQNDLSNQTDSIASYSSSSSASSYNLNSPALRTIKNFIHTNTNAVSNNELSQSELFVNEMIAISIPTIINNSVSLSPSSSSSKSTPIHSTGFNTPLLKKQSIIRNKNAQSLNEFLSKTADIMIYLNLKETLNNIDFFAGFGNFILSHYRENPNLFSDQMKQFNHYRQNSISLCSEPSEYSLTQLFEYYKSITIVEKRFFQNSQCNQIYFTWYDSINGVESTQKSIQFEKASIMFNCSALYSQLAAICCDINDQKLEEQMIYWLKAAGCINYLNTNFTNSPSLDMSPFILDIFFDIFLSQAYEIKTKILLMDKNESGINHLRHIFFTFINCSKIYAHIAHIYDQISTKLTNNQPIKSYLPEIWYFLIKVKSLYCSGMSHYFAGLALTINGLENISHLEEVKAKFNSLHDRSRIKSYNAPITNLNDQTIINSPKNYFQKLFNDQQMIYDSKILENNKRIFLAKLHMRESTILQEEAIRQHSFCRKFSKDDYLHNILQHYHEISIENFIQLEKTSVEEIDDELIDLLPINYILNENITLDSIAPTFDKYDSKDFFNLLGPIKVYSSENELSIPYSCILRKLPNNPTFGITIKGDSPVRINHVDPSSYAYCAGIRQGDYIIAIQDNDVRWSKHSDVVSRIRSQKTSVKLTLLSCKTIPREVPIFCEDNLNNKIKNCFDKAENTILSHSSCKKILSNNFNSDEPDLIENHIWWNKAERNKKNLTKFEKPKQRIFKMPNGLNSIRSKSPFFNLLENNFVTNKICNIVENNSKNSNLKYSKYKLNNLFRSTNNLCSPKNNDCRDSKDNIAFWNNLKSIKNPITNTITLGRKFKRNVLKLNLFSNLSDTNNLNSCQKFDEDIPKNFKIPPLTNAKNTSSVKFKKLKTKNKLKELDKLNNNVKDDLKKNRKNEIFYKTI